MGQPSNHISTCPRFHYYESASFGESLDNSALASQIPLPVADDRCKSCAYEQTCVPHESAIWSGRDMSPSSRPTPSVHLNRVLYVDEPGAYVRKEGERFVITLNDKVLREIPVHDIDEMVMLSHVNWSSASVKLILDHRIPVSIISPRGEYLGQFTPAFSKNSILRIQQQDAWRSAERKIDLARRIVSGKLTNMRTVLQRYARSREPGLFDSPLYQLSQAQAKVELCGDRAELLGWEGQGSKAYFDGLRRLIPAPFTFDKRTRRPPRDPVNAMLSLAYTLLQRQVMTAIQVAGLDPYIGFLHEARYGLPALSLDIMEEFRPILADSVVLSYLLRQRVKPEDFYYEGEACLMQLQARKKFYLAFEARMKEMVTHPVFGQAISYRRTLELQARYLAKVLSSELPVYQPFTVR